MATSHKRMATLGWQRIDPRPWSKCNATWRHSSGWTLQHCGHPTANWPWQLLPPDSVTHVDGVKIQPVGVRMGVMNAAAGRAGNCATGYAWIDMDTATTWLAQRPDLTGGPARLITWRGTRGRGPGGRRYDVRQQPTHGGRQPTWAWNTSDAGAAPFDSAHEAQLAAEGHAENLKVHIDARRRQLKLEPTAAPFALELQDEP